jgi:hypothetical protein
MKNEFLTSSLSFVKKYFTNWYAIIIFIVMVWGIAYFYNNISSPKNTTSVFYEKSIRNTNVQQPCFNLVERNIEDIKIGDRTSGHNPESSFDANNDLDETTLQKDWQLLSLQMIKSDGSIVTIELLRPTSWIETREAKPGNTIYLDLAELGAEGDALVLSIKQCPKIQSGPGNIVTGTFRHQSSNLIDLYINGIDKPIGCTANHPFWSVDRKMFISAEDLYSGERVALHENKTASVHYSLPRHGNYTVYNLEIYGEHVYEVTSRGILVHNKCAGLHHL